MATVYSLVCWGGRTGKTVTASSGNLLALTNHGLRTSTTSHPVSIKLTSGTPPSGLALNTTYYVGVNTPNNFKVYSDAECVTQVTFSAGGSSLVAKSGYYLGLADKSRWTTGGVERIYDGLGSWKTARAAATTTLLTEVCELGEAFTETHSGTFTLNLMCASARITSRLNGSRSSAWHAGKFNPTVGLGYVLQGTSGGGGGLFVATENSEIEGFIVSPNNTGSTAINLVGIGATARNMIARGPGAKGIFLQGSGVKAYSCIAKGFSGKGFDVTSFVSGLMAVNCLSVGNTTGFGNDGSSSRGRYFNNISVGNTTNWAASTLSTDQLVASASNNAGLSGEAWTTSGGTRLTIATTDFIDFAGEDWSPALDSSPQVDSGVAYYGVITSDIRDAEVPNYNNGGYESVDVGPYEYDHGYGPHPASATISLTSIVSGSRVLITKASDGTVLYNDVPGTSLSFSTTHIGDFNVVVRKATASPFYREFNASGTTVADQTTSIKCLQQLDE